MYSFRKQQKQQTGASKTFGYSSISYLIMTGQSDMTNGCRKQFLFLVVKSTADSE